MALQLAGGVPSTRKPVVPPDGQWQGAGAQDGDSPYESLVDANGDFNPTAKPPAVPQLPSFAGAAQEFRAAQRPLMGKPSGDAAPPPVDDRPTGTQLAGRAAPPPVPVMPMPASVTENPAWGKNIDALEQGAQRAEALGNQSGDLSGQAADPTAKAKPSLARKLVGIAAGVGTGLLTANPLAGLGAYEGITGAPERERQKNLAGQITGVKARQEGLKEGMATRNTLADALSSADTTAASRASTAGAQANSLRTAETSRVGDASKTIEVPVGNGLKQKMGYNTETLNYDRPQGQPEPMQPNESVPVTPEMVVKYPDLKNVKEITQSTWVQLQQEDRLNKPPVEGTKTTDIKDYEYDVEHGYKGTITQWRNEDANRHKPAPTTFIVGGYAGLDETRKTAVDSAADRVASGELSPSSALAMLGGVRSGMGQPLLEAIGTRRILPPKVREESTAIERAKALMIPVRQLVAEINATSDIQQKAVKSLQLENYVSSIGTQFARAKGERGVVTDQDVSRVLGLIPGWKSANFAPGFAEQNLKIIEDTFKRDQDQLLNKYFLEVPIRPGGALAGPTSTTTSRPRAGDGKGNFVEWDGKAWVPVAK